MLTDEMKSLCEDLGLEKVQKRGDNIMFCCPFHGEHNPSCGISVTKEVGGCFACGKAFNLAQLVAHCKHISYVEALDLLSLRFNRDFQKPSESLRFKMYGETSNEVDETLPKSALAPFRSGEVVHPYLERRGFDSEDFVKFNLGWDSLKKRITIPFFTKEGKLLGFSGRAVLNELDEGYSSVYGGEPKYLIYNHFKAKDYFYPLDKFTPKNGEVILVEGLLDAVWMHKMGFTNTLSIVSAQISKVQVKKLKTLDVQKIILCLDNDKAGEQGCEMLYKKLKNNFTFVKATLPSGKKDVQDCTKEELTEMMGNLEVFPKREFKVYE